MAESRSPAVMAGGPGQATGGRFYADGFILSSAGSGVPSPGPADNVALAGKLPGAGRTRAGLGDVTGGSGTRLYRPRLARLRPPPNGLVCSAATDFLERPGRPSQYPLELRRRAVRMVAEVRPEYDTEWAAMKAVAQKLGIGTTETLRGRTRSTPGPARARRRRNPRRSRR